MSFSSLPLEVVVQILSSLKPSHIVKASLTCKSFYRASRVTKLWKTVCEKEHNVTGEQIGSSSFEDFYAKVLHHYGRTLGLWQMQIEHYGGLLSVKVVDGEIIATQLLPPIDPEVWMPFKRKNLFNIFVDSEGKTVVQCVKGSGGPHKMKILKGNSPNEFSLLCKQPEKHSKYHKRKEDFANWIYDEVGIPHEDGIEGYQVELLRIKYLSFQQYESSCSFTFLPPIHPLPNVPIQPGLFKGTYGGHGVEVIQLIYEGNRLHGIKVSGDPNVPAGKKSIEVHLDEPLVLNRDQQRNLTTELQKKEYIVPEDQAAPERQPFSLPFGVEDRGFAKLCEQKDICPDYCRARFFATGLIAMHGFRNSSSTDCHFIIFDEDNFAFLWMQLGSLSVYSRADDFL